MRERPGEAATPAKKKLSGQRLVVFGGLVPKDRARQTDELVFVDLRVRAAKPEIPVNQLRLCVAVCKNIVC